MIILDIAKESGRPQGDTRDAGTELLLRDIAEAQKLKQELTTKLSISARTDFMRL